MNSLTTVVLLTAVILSVYGAPPPKRLPPVKQPLPGDGRERAGDDSRPGDVPAADKSGKEDTMQKPNKQREMMEDTTASGQRKEGSDETPKRQLPNQPAKRDGDDKPEAGKGKKSKAPEVPKNETESEAPTGKRNNNAAKGSERDDAADRDGDRRADSTEGSVRGKGKDSRPKRDLKKDNRRPDSRARKHGNDDVTQKSKLGHE